MKAKKTRGLFSKALALFYIYKDKYKRDGIYNYAASTSFYIFLSIFPFLILLLTIVQYTPVTKDFLVSQFEQIFPNVIAPLFIQIVEEIYGTTSGAAIISIAALLAIWSASKATMSITRGINAAYEIEDKRNYFRVKFMSCVYVVAFAIMIIVVLILLIFGKRIYMSIHEINLPLYSALHFILRFRIILMLIIMTMFFSLIYCVMPARKSNFFDCLPGAALCSAGWTILSQILSIYLNKSTSFTYFYGSLTTLILMMLWFYISMYIIFICAEVNFFIKHRKEIKELYNSLLEKN